MVIKTTTWTLDTCGCTVEYDWNDNGNDAEDKAHTFKQVDHVCGGHVQVDEQLGHQALFDKIKEENVRKNKVYKAVIEDSNDIGEDKVQDDGTIVRALKSDVDFEYEFEGSALDTGGRKIRVRFKDKKTNGKKALKVADKKKAEDDLTAEGIDPGKVLIE